MVDVVVGAAVVDVVGAAVVVVGAAVVDVVVGAAVVDVTGAAVVGAAVVGIGTPHLPLIMARPCSDQL